MISIFLTVLLLVSNSGVVLAQHFCGEYKMMEEISLGEKHLSCGIVMEQSSCGDEHEEDHDCCENHYVSVSTDTDYSSTSTFTLDFQHDFIVAFVSVFADHSWIAESTTATFYLEYNPPPLVKDIPVLYETFLI
ncbi:MAG: HYC_CC_PP family protein [Patiriisocius sp.]|uniref:HYC_CC_PP family protein n=1 Tax=Patiriisocius sp. TaxID=2822396 RepID=UPI003EF58C84